MRHNDARIKFRTGKFRCVGRRPWGLKVKVKRTLTHSSRVREVHAGRPTASKIMADVRFTRLVYKFDVLPYKYLCDHSGQGRHLL